MAIINQLGLTKSAGVGVAEKVCGFIMLVPSAYMQALSAYVAQNVGAGKLERAKKALYYSIGTSIVAGMIMFYVAFFRGELLASIFSNDWVCSLLYPYSCFLGGQPDSRSKLVSYRTWNTSVYDCADFVVSGVYVLFV